MQRQHFNKNSSAPLGDWGTGVAILHIPKTSGQPNMKIVEFKNGAECCVVLHGEMIDDLRDFLNENYPKEFSPYANK